MKIITRFLCASFLTFAVSFTGGAQVSNGMETLEGFSTSQHSGLIAKLKKWERFGVKHQNERPYEPHKKMLAQLGIKENATITPFTNYQFYGGESYKGNNVPYASVTDAAGNTYITGGSTNESQPAGDFFTMKISPLGTILWEARKPAAKYAVEYGMEATLDNNGNLVVTGLKWNGNDMDIQTVKYTPAGTELWSAVYSSPYEGIDVPSAMVTGPDGSIYITGISFSGNSVDYLTLKYNADGTQAWMSRKNGGGDETWNEATALAVDAAGNVIVTGYSPNPQGWLNYYTIKYSPEGEELWTQAYNYASTDPDNPSDVTNSVPRAVTTDSNNNIYITGTFDTFLGRIGTIKYNAAGEQQWVNTYKSGDEKTQGWQIGLKNNTLYVAGTHNGGFADDGNVLISYGLDGSENWIEETTDLIDAVNTELLFDITGNPVVGAKGMTPGAEEWQQDNAARVKKYSPEGVLLGQAAFVISSPEGTASMGDMAGMGLDAAGNVYMAVNSFYSAEGAVYETVKSTFGITAQAPAWNTTYSNFGSPAASMLHSFPDSSGNTISTGVYYNFADGMLLSNYFVVKHDAAGNVAWDAVFNSGNGNPAGGIIARPDKNNNILVTLLPEFEGTLTIKKISPAGTELWEHEITLNNPQVYVMETGDDGSVYLGGTAFENETDEHASFVGIKLNASGGEEWATFTTGTNSGDNIYAVNGGKVTTTGELILTGGLGSGDFMSQDVHLAVVKYNSDGSPAWITPVTVSGSSASGSDLMIGIDGSIYTNGFAQSNTTGLENMVTAKLSSSGALQWAQQYGDEDRKERSYTLQQFANGDIAVIGYSLGMDGDIHNVLIRYNAAGSVVWDFTSEEMRYYNDFHIDGAGICYIMDQAIINPFPHKIYDAPFPIATLIRVDSEGNGEEEFFPGPEYAEFYGEQLIPHADNRLLLGGSAGNQSFYEGLYFFETEHEGSLGLDSPEVTEHRNYLGQNYPNPVSATTTIPFDLVSGGKGSIKLYNSQGRLIKEIATGTFDTGHNTVRFDSTGIAPGIYLYQLTSGNFKQSRKMIITK